MVSKFSQPHRTKELENCFDESARKLFGILNIYLLHWPFTFLWKRQWKAMEDIYLAGKCQAIGVCNFEVDNLKELQEFARVKPAINQIERHPLFQQNEIVAYCQEHDIQIMSYSPVARLDNELFESVVLNDLARKYNKTVSQVILRWDLDTGTIPIPASKSKEHIYENIDIFDFSLNQSELKTINRLDIGKRIRFDPKKRFSLITKLRFLKYRIIS